MKLPKQGEKWLGVENNQSLPQAKKENVSKRVPPLNSLFLRSNFKQLAGWGKNQSTLDGKGLGV